MRGRFIVFEGIDGCGKTTQALLLATRLREDGYRVLFTEEPTRDLVTGNLVKLLLKSKETPPPESYLLLFLADRIHHMKNRIGPALERGEVVISDRYHYSSLAYQGAQGVEMGRIDGVLEVLGVELIEPDVVFLVDVPVEVALERMAKVRNTTEVYEKREFLEKVRENYLRLAEKLGFVVVNGDRDVEEIHGEIYEKVKELLSR